MITTISSRLILNLIIAGIPAYSGPIQAAGFQLTETCARCEGVRNAGMSAASIQGAAALNFNPASMTRLKGSNVDINTHFIYPRIQFKDRGSTNAFGNNPPFQADLGGPATGDHHDDAGQSAVVPTAFYSYNIDSQWAMGLGISAPFGLATNYSNNWVGRYNAIESSLIILNINPAVAFKFNEQISLGAGVNVMYASARLTNALDYGTVSFMNTGGRLGVPSSRQYDGFQKLTGDGRGYGWNVGILYEPLPGTRFGAAYRSKVNIDLAGDSRIRGNPAFAQALGPLSALATSQKLGISVKLNLPASLMLGAYQDITDCWAIMVGATWVNWSGFKEVRVDFQHNALPDTVQPQNWKDTWRTAIGTSYRLNDSWTLLGGFESDATPVRTKYRNPRIPDEDRYWFTAGAGYKPARNFSFDFGYSYLISPISTIDNTETTTSELTQGVPVGNTVKGKYKGATNIFSAEVTWAF